MLCPKSDASGSPRCVRRIAMVNGYKLKHRSMRFISSTNSHLNLGTDEIFRLQSVSKWSSKGTPVQNMQIPATRCVAPGKCTSGRADARGHEKGSLLLLSGKRSANICYNKSFTRLHLTTALLGMWLSHRKEATSTQLVGADKASGGEPMPPWAPSPF